MKLLRLRMFDFRQFLGETVIDFAQGDRTVVTIVHGENGVGKTTILNAIYWCFYGDTLDDFERKHHLVNDIAIAKYDRESTKVEVEFFHNDTEYRIERTYFQPNNTSEVRGFKVSRGNSIPFDGMATVIRRIIPSSMAPYFFFHGEGLNSLGVSVAKNEFHRAIRAILGFSHADDVIAMMERIKVRWQTEASKLEKLDDRARTAIEREIEASKEMAEAKENLIMAENNLLLVEQELDNIDKEIASINVRDLDELTTERTRKELRQKKIPKEMDAIKNQEIQLISKYGWSLYGHSTLQDSADLLKEFRTERKLPSEYNDRFINSLLAENVCICGTSLPASSEARTKVEGMLSGASTTEQEDALTSAIGVAENIKDVSDEYTRHVTALSRRRQTLIDEQGHIARRLEEIRDELGKVDHNRLKKLEADRDDARQLAERLRDNKHLCSIKFNGARKNRDEAQRKKKTTVDVSKLGKYRVRLDFVDRAISRLTEIIGLEESSARVEMEKFINERLQKYSRKDYLAELREDFTFELKKEDGTPVAKSKGEKALLNISFISALILLAKNRSEQYNEYFVQGTVAPFVIDAPFGELDNEYRGAVANFLPESTEQLIVLLSSSHWNQVVERGLREHTGEEYILVSESHVDPSAGKTVDEILINGQKYQCSRYGKEHTRTIAERI